MSSSGPNSPGTCADDATVGTVAWTSPNSAKTEGTSFTYVIISLGVFSHYLKATNFGFTIPTGATINGIVAEAKTGITDGVGITKDYRARIVKSDASIGATDKSNATTWIGSWNGGNMVYLSHGGSTDLWGETWSAADINNSNFGFALSAQNSDTEDGDTPQVDHIRITVYYTEAAGGNTSNFFQFIN
jgi:hypothetical protein